MRFFKIWFTFGYSYYYYFIIFFTIRTITNKSWDLGAGKKELICLILTCFNIKCKFASLWLKSSGSMTCINTSMNERSEQKTSWTHCRPLLWLKAFLPRGCTVKRNLVSTILLNHCFPHSLPNGTHTHPHTHTHKYTFIPSKVLRSPSLCDCTSFYIPLHVSTFWRDLASSKLKKTTIDTDFATEKKQTVKMKWNQTWNTGFISYVGWFVSYLAERQLVEKAAAGYRGLIRRRFPADLSWLGRFCPWLKGSSVLEVFGIDCSKLHHKPPLKGNVFTVSPNEEWQGQLARRPGTAGCEISCQLQEPCTLTQPTPVSSSSSSER